MANFACLDNERDFPAWIHLPDKQTLDPVYHDITSTTNRRTTADWREPKRHWCFLGEIESFDQFGRYRTIVKDDDDEKQVVAFYLDNYKDFNFGKLSRGHTMAIMYAHQHGFIDGTHGVRVERAEHVRIFPMSLLKLQKVSRDMNKYCKPTGEQWKCHGCDKLIGNGAASSRCGKCKMVYYCDKDCQAKGWNERDHKIACKVLSDPGFMMMIKTDFSTYTSQLKFPKQ